MTDEGLITLLFLVLAGLIAVNVVVNACLYYFSNIKKTKMLVMYWVSLLLTYALQGQFQEGQLLIILAFSVNILPCLIISKIQFDSLEVEFRLKKYLLLWAGGLTATLFLNLQDHGFTVTAFPVAGAMAFTLLDSAILPILKKRRRSSVLQKFMGFIYLAGALHLINFAIFRMDPGAQLWGWGTAFALYQMLSLTLFAFVFEEYAKQEKIRLQDLVDEKTRELNKALKENEGLLKVLIHDISNPLMVISWYANSLRPEDDSSHDRLAKMKRSIAVLDKIIKNVKELKTNKTQKVPLTPLSLEECFNEVSFIFAKALDQKNITLRLTNHLSPKTKFLADKTTFIHSVLSNLVSNALKFSAPGKEIEIVALEKGGEVVLEVKDKGPGISKELLNALNNGELLQSTQGTMGEAGSGMGLSIVKSFVDVYGGQIEFDSRPYFLNPTNHGTDVRIMLSRA